MNAVREPVGRFGTEPRGDQATVVLVLVLASGS